MLRVEEMPLVVTPLTSGQMEKVWLCGRHPLTAIRTNNQQSTKPSCHSIWLEACLAAHTNHKGRASGPPPATPQTARLILQNAVVSNTTAHPRHCFSASTVTCRAPSASYTTIFRGRRDLQPNNPKHHLGSGAVSCSFKGTLNKSDTSPAAPSHPDAPGVPWFAAEGLRFDDQCLVEAPLEASLGVPVLVRRAAASQRDARREALRRGEGPSLNQGGQGKERWENSG